MRRPPAVLYPNAMGVVSGVLLGLSGPLYGQDWLGALALMPWLLSRALWSDVTDGEPTV